METNSSIEVYCDGASLGNPGPGGWGAIVLVGDWQVQELGGSSSRATNNQMEIQAAISALSWIKNETATGSRGPVTVKTDSKYLIDGASKWIRGWRSRGWKTAEGEDVKNQDLWKTLADLIQSLSINWIHVSAHVGIPGNERADQIASSFAQKNPVPLYSGPRADYSLKLSEKRGPAIQTAGNDLGVSDFPVYLSDVDGKVEQHREWPSCQARVSGVSGAKFKKVSNARELEETIARWKRGG